MAISDLIAYCNHRWRVEHGIAEDLLFAGKRRISAQLRGIEFSSRFEAVRMTEVTAVTVGHIARLRTRLTGGAQRNAADAAAESDPTQIIRFDRLCRTLHLLNYLSWRTHEQARLFLDVEARHILAVPHGHGAYFASVIHRCGLAPGDIVLSTSSIFGASPGDYLRRLAGGMANYRSRGYRIALSLNEFPLSKAWCDFLYFVAPDYVRLPAERLGAARRTRTALVSVHLKRLGGIVDSFGGQLLLEGIADAASLELARSSGIPLIQGPLLESRRRFRHPLHNDHRLDQEHHV